MRMYGRRSSSIHRYPHFPPGSGLASPALLDAPGASRRRPATARHQMRRCGASSRTSFPGHDRSSRPDGIATVGWVPLPATFPDLGALDLFCTVADLGSLSRAAEAHGIAQPSASSRIRNLERRLGVRLLTRSPTGSVPTADGLLVAEWAATVMSAARSLQGGVDAIRSRRGGICASLQATPLLSSFSPGGWRLFSEAVRRSSSRS